MHLRYVELILLLQDDHDACPEIPAKSGMATVSLGSFGAIKLSPRKHGIHVRIFKHGHWEDLFPVD
jgi:hypothetical protein